MAKLAREHAARSSPRSFFFFFLPLSLLFLLASRSATGARVCDRVNRRVHLSAPCDSVRACVCVRAFPDGDKSEWLGGNRCQLVPAARKTEQSQSRYLPVQKNARQTGNLHLTTICGIDSERGTLPAAPPSPGSSQPCPSLTHTLG